MNEQEIEARKICAYCNFSNKCVDCPYRDWSKGGELYYEPRWNYLECEEWRYYLVNPIVSKWRRLLCLLGLHKWYVHNHIKPFFILHRSCTRCKVVQYYDNSFNRGNWLWLNRKMI